ncbi:hypothetical protein TSUD_392510 [Trifolium subterraneum]|uniref:PGG domain-containing protein n=1 Tax=Trifolium subterraneum TaxID=3900 RepID=A0A2Z6MFA0_TRISU|nr:hypothetical protein TSUD_392510 [Trifolium subterraneum]
MINLNEKNLDNKTSLDIAITQEMKSILFSVGAKPSSEVIVDPTLDRVLIRIVNESLINSRSISGEITEKERNTWLIVATLIATAMYASMLSPLGGVYQISAIACGIIGMVNFDMFKLLQWDRNVKKLSRWQSEPNMLLNRHAYRFNVQPVGSRFNQLILMILGEFSNEPKAGHHFLGVLAKRAGGDTARQVSLEDLKLFVLSHHVVARSCWARKAYF